MMSPDEICRTLNAPCLTSNDCNSNDEIDKIVHLRWMIPPMVVHPEKIDFRRFL